MYQEQTNDRRESVWMADSAEKSADPAEKMAEMYGEFSKRHKQILSFMSEKAEYSAEEIAEHLGLKGSRTRQLLKELVDRGVLSITAETKKRKYKKNRF